MMEFIFLSIDKKEAWLERAAIRHFDGLYPWDEAEEIAYKDLGYGQGQETSDQEGNGKSYLSPSSKPSQRRSKPRQTKRR